MLHEGHIELPSDIAGIAYISLDGQWKHELARELKDADIPFKSRLAAAKDTPGNFVGLPVSFR